MKKLLFSAAFASISLAASAQSLPDLAFGKIETVEATTTVEILNKGSVKAMNVWVETQVGTGAKQRQKIVMLEAGGMTEIEIELPATGEKMVKVWLDPGNKIKEKSENNNKYPNAVTADPGKATKKGMKKSNN